MQIFNFSSILQITLIHSFNHSFVHLWFTHLHVIRMIFWKYFWIYFYIPLLLSYVGFGAIKCFLSFAVKLDILFEYVSSLLPYWGKTIHSFIHFLSKHLFGPYVPATSPDAGDKAAKSKHYCKRKDFYISRDLFHLIRVRPGRLGSRFFFFYVKEVLAWEKEDGEKSLSVPVEYRGKKVSEAEEKVWHQSPACSASRA